MADAEIDGGVKFGIVELGQHVRPDDAELRGAVRDEGRDVESADADQLDMRHIGGEAQRAAVFVAECGFGMDTGAGEQGKGLGEDAPLGHGDD
ncbi:hypothetical protein WR25_00541 [Diploscapter pachys]|uniref:Uncharacterized protein n=1 Tax=Diploscapter pachys TaxID=2018661 RepID=A0A2A2M3K2_9BILA|nr:hypothetical protein WR25_00541 [Diploscapter pachys]